MSNLTDLLFEFMPLFHSKVSSKLVWTGEEDKINRSQEKAMMITSKEGSVLPSTLGKCLDMKPGSLTTLLDGLVDQGLAQRSPDPQDRRKLWISLTPEGLTHVENRQTSVKKQMERILETLTPEDHQSLETHLRDAFRIISKL